MSISRTTSGGPARPPQDPEAPTTRGSTWAAHLDIRLDGGAVSRRVLAEPHVVIGRIAGVQIFLDHHTVSRRHAEMFCDPFGRWWIRDLRSTNGTFVNDEPVTERALAPGDRIAVGDFVLTFHVEAHDPAGAPGRVAAVDSDDPTEIRSLLDFQPPRLEAEHLRTLLDFGRQLIGVESAEERVAQLCQLAVHRDFHATAAVVLRLQGGVATQISRAYHPGGRIADDAPYVSRRVLHAVRETRAPVLAGNLRGAGDPEALDLTISRELMWIIACPLRVGADAIDLLHVTLPPSHGGAEWLSLFALAAEVYQQSEVTWAARRHAEAHAAVERELATARQIQRALLPKRLAFPGLDVAVGFEPCRWVGGDYVDAVPLPDGRVLLTVADVCGKGLHAALVASSLHTMVRACSDSAPSLAALVERVNRHLCEWLPEHSFVTMVAAAIDPATGAMECANTGHPPALIVDRDGDLRALQSAANPALGVAPFGVEAQRTLLELGDVLVMYTDGLTELRGPSREMLGQDRLGEGFARVCAAHRGERAVGVAEALRLLLEDFRGDQRPEDDRAFVVAQRIG